MSEQPEREIIHRELDTDGEKPAIQLAQAVAEIEEKDMTELPTMYNCVDGVLNHLFSNPPSPEAQMEIEFSYETYRISVEQNGTATFVKTG